ncbi:hypothetical protein CSUI_005520, partial [Cystoisospora suis]
FSFISFCPWPSSFSISLSSRVHMYQ